MVAEPPPPTSSLSPATGPAVLRLATFNVQHGRTPAGPVDAAVLARTCAALGADVLGLQEVDVGTHRVGRVDLAGEVASATGMAVTFGPTRPLGPGRYGNALLARGALADVELLDLPSPPPMPFKVSQPFRTRHEARGAILASVVLSRGVRLSVAVCHLGLVPGEAETQLVAALARLAGRPGPRVLLGDLNLPPEPVQPLVEAAGFTLTGGPPTFPGHQPARRIDHVALAGLVPTAVVVPAVPVSDHRPLVVEVEVQ